jgi:type I restriction enzyme S subunit
LCVKLRHASDGSGFQSASPAQQKTPNTAFPRTLGHIAITEILSDMDAEITALEGKLVKARQVKQGMMSELLTGRVRLV